MSNLGANDFAVIKVYSLDSKWKKFIAQIIDDPNEDEDFEAIFLKRSIKIKDGFIYVRLGGVADVRRGGHYTCEGMVYAIMFYGGMVLFSGGMASPLNSSTECRPTKHISQSCVISIILHKFMFRFRFCYDYKREQQSQSSV